MSGVKRYSVKAPAMNLHLEHHSLGTIERVVVMASDYDAALAREAALREELATSRAAFKEELDGVKYTRRKFRQERDALQQRLTEAERYVQKMIDCSQGQGSIATGYLADILAKLKPAEGKGRE